MLSSGSPRWGRYSPCLQRNAYSSSGKDLYIKKYKKMWLLFNHRGTITPILMLWNSLGNLSKQWLGNECSSFGWDPFSINATMDYCTVTVNSITETDWVPSVWEDWARCWDTPSRWHTGLPLVSLEPRRWDRPTGAEESHGVQWQHSMGRAV